jgi:GT2 family glycosyltransferase
VSEPDRGQSEAINKGLRRSTGRLFNWHNADDVLLPGSVAAAARAFVANAPVSYTWGYPIIVDEESRALSHLIRFPQSGRLPTLEWSLAHLNGGCQPGCLMDRELVARVGGVDERLHFAMDADLFLRLQMHRPPFYLGQATVYFRTHSASKSTCMRAQRARDWLMIAHRVFGRRRLPFEARRLRRAAFACAHSLARRNYADAGLYRWAAWHAIAETCYAPPGPLAFAKIMWGGGRELLCGAGTWVVPGPHKSA